MKSIIKIIFIIFPLFFSCEKEEILNANAEYTELLVMQCEIYPEFNFPGVRLTRTLPLGVVYDIKLAEIKNATMYLRINNVKIIPLHYTMNGIYKPLYDLYVNQGEVYEIFGELDEQSFYAKTVIPYTPVVQSISYDLTEHYAKAVLLSNKNECYSALWAIQDTTMIFAEDFFSVSVFQDTTIGSVVNVRSAAYTYPYRQPVYNGRRYIQLFAFDFSFEKYFKSKLSGNTINNPYVQGTSNTVWNVKGNNIIGMFIGVSKGELLFVN